MLQYTVFEQLKDFLLRPDVVVEIVGTDRRLSKSSPKALTAFQAFLVGASSKTIATILTYPAIRAKVMLQAAESEEDKATRLNGEPDCNARHRARNMLDTFKQIGQEEGVKGYFKGLHAQIVKTVLSAALMLMIKEKVATSTWIVMMAFRKWLLTSGKQLKTVSVPPSAVAPIAAVGVALASKAAK